MDVTLFDASVIFGKTIVVLVVLLLLYRVLGKRDLAQMNPYDMVTIMAVANAVQNAMTQGRGELVIGIASSSALILGAFGLTRLFVAVPSTQKILLGEPVVLLHDGQMAEVRMKQAHVTHEELLAALRQHGLFKMSQADLAVLEVDGSISVIPKGTATRVDLNC